ncbi:ABC-2 type transport system permease protein [Kineococcus xinjiangensis]|uniref:ABC-2 type transport system permease protein n=1 Tax=Kineococcus xinjiangensis TaxID=512762 RepID=A0A2S6ITW0_9ACTN|nr:ABC transporter permease subunit [Kineococcus xinjiangensis]PPK97658.1 ABC-2 type transport system permease protein [Kineococcus xinjiangensis]
MSLFEAALRGVLLRGRTAAFALLPLAVAAVVLAVVFLTSVPGRYGAVGTVTAQLLVGLVVPVVALVLGTGAFGDERDGGTLPLLRGVARPRWHLVAAKLFAAWLSTWLVCLPASVACIVFAASVNQPLVPVVGGVLLATALAAGAYCGLFVLLSLLTRRALLAGLAYVVLWEGFLAGLSPGLRGLSVGSYARRVAELALPDDVQTGVVSTLSAPWAVVVLLAVVAGTWALSGVRLHRMDVTTG